VVAEGYHSPDARNKKSRVVIDPTEWSHAKPSENSDLESHRSMRSSQLRTSIPAELQFKKKDDVHPAEDKRPFKPFANFNKPVTLYEMSRISI
jgi:hypothetical protein